MYNFKTKIEINIFYISNRTFTREWNIKLEQKRQLEFEKEQAVRKLADEEKSKWVSQRDMKMKSKMENNRSEEVLFKEQLQSEAENLKTWERVSKLIDAGEGVDMKEGYDTSRMHKLFIQLKNEPLESTRAE